MLEGRGPVVLKQHRGMGGTGVWKVELAGPDSVHVQQFLARCEPYFAGTGLMVEQPFQSRLAEGMIRASMTHDKVVGFAHQYPQGLLAPEDAARAPSSKTFELATEPCGPWTRLNGSHRRVREPS